MRYTQNEPFLLLFGDVLVFYLSLWITLALREFSIPSQEYWLQHAIPFSLLFLVSVVVYFIAGLYDQHTSLMRSKLPRLVAYSQFASVLVAAMFFFSVPYFGITPKTILVIYLALSSFLIVIWRLVVVRHIGVRGQTGALVIGKGKEIDELIHELNASPSNGLVVRHQFAPEDVDVSGSLQEQILEFITKENITTVIVHTRDPRMVNITPVFYNLLFLHPNLTVLDALQLYENVFRRIPISMLEETWFLEHITRQRRVMYDFFHRTVDIFSALLLGIPTLIILPFVALAMRLDDKGALFITQHRIGKLNKPVAHVKVRSMSFNDETLSGTRDEEKAKKNKVTRLGGFLRKTRIDELPQLWNIFVGDYSLIGPRPELPAGVQHYAELIPYYNARHLIKPGLTGWAQINHQAHPHHGVDVDETRNKLSYDLYYLKNRSVWLDFEIGLKTIKTLLTAVGK